MEKTRKKYKEVFQYDYVKFYVPALISCIDRLKTSGVIASEVISPLMEAFNFHNVRTDYFNPEWWTCFAHISSVPDSEGANEQHALAAAVNRVPTDRIDIRDFIHFYALATRVGMFTVAFSLRFKAREAAILGAESFMHDRFEHFSYSIGALHELGRMEEAERLIRRARSTNPRYLAQEAYLRMMLSGGTINPKHLLQAETPEDKAFATWIKGKSIAIVGPAKTDQQDAAEIDSFDLVVRCNYKEKGAGTDPVHKGLRCDIAYYNVVQMDNILDSTLSNWPMDLPWLVHKKKNPVETVRKKISELRNYRFQNRIMAYLPHVLFNGNLNAIPNIVLDVYRFQPGRVKVFHSDLMLTVERNEGYRSRVEEEVFDKSLLYLENFAVDEPLTQFYILRSLFHNGRIEGDERFSQIMNLTEEGFVGRLQERFGDVGKVK